MLTTRFLFQQKDFFFGFRGIPALLQDEGENKLQENLRRYLRAVQKQQLQVIIIRVMEYKLVFNRNKILNIIYKIG